MKYCRAFAWAALLVLAFTIVDSMAGPSQGKNPKSKVVRESGIVVPVPDTSRNRFGVLATGGFGIEAKFVSDAFTKKDPKSPMTELSYEEGADLSAGFEVFYERLFSDPTDVDLYGVRIGVGYTQIEVEDRRSALDDFGDPVQLMQDLDADLVYLNVGPFYERRLTDRFYAQVSAGLTAAYIDANLNTSDNGAIDADAGEDETLFGAYASLAIGFDVASNWSILGGVRYQYLDRFSIDNGVTDAELDFDSVYMAFLGLRFEF